MFWRAFRRLFTTFFIRKRACLRLSTGIAASDSSLCVMDGNVDAGKVERRPNSGGVCGNVGVQSGEGETKNSCLIHCILRMSGPVPVLAPSIRPPRRGSYFIVTGCAMPPISLPNMNCASGLSRTGAMRVCWRVSFHIASSAPSRKNPIRLHCIKSPAGASPAQRAYFRKRQRNHQSTYRIICEA